MSNHTATPWEIVELEKPLEPWGSFVIRAPEAPGGIAVTVGGIGEEERANAHLIKAAPKMYEALAKIRDRAYREYPVSIGNQNAWAAVAAWAAGVLAEADGKPS